MSAALYEEAKRLLKSGKFLCLLGGEHSVSAPVIRAHAEKFHNISILQIDAHADLRDEYDGTKHSHASIMARCVRDLKIPAVQVGIRSLSSEEARILSDIPTKDLLGKRYCRAHRLD